MLRNEKIIGVAFCCHLFILVRTYGYRGNGDAYQDQTSSRPNTLNDDADDIQKQLDNEARDRLKYGHPKTVWVFHFPTTTPGINTILDVKRFRKVPRVFRKRATIPMDNPSMLLDDLTDWTYEDQNNWYKRYSECSGRSQSPVDIPAKGLLEAKGSRQLLFNDYNTPPQKLTLMNDGKQVLLFGKWKSKHEPLVYGGAAQSRRYVFHSMSLHWPSEHTIGGLQYPIESQVIHVSAQYRNMNEAIEASSRDHQAILAVSNLYKFSNYTQNGLQDLILAALHVGVRNATMPTRPLSYFNPPFNRYASYHGSLTVPPCTQSVLWFVRSKALPVTRKTVDAAHDILSPEKVPRTFFNRQVQSINDRKIYYFN